MTTRELNAERPASMILGTNQGLPRTHELAAMQAQLTRGDLSLSPRWQLMKEYNQAVKSWFRTQIDNALTVAEAGTRATADIKLKEIAVYLTKSTLELRSTHLQTMRSYGMRIEEEQLEFAFAASEKLSEKLNQLATANITPAYKKRLVAMVDATFDRMISELEALTQNLLKTVDQLRAID